MARATRRKTVKKLAAKRATKKSAKRFTATPAGRSDREHLIALIKESTGCSSAAAKETLEGVIGTIASSLKKNKKAQIYGFGTFTVTKLPARKGRNPQTGESIRVKASKAIRFRASKTLKESV